MIWGKPGLTIEKAVKLPPKSKLNTAIEYTLSRWVELGRYILNGELEIDNEKASWRSFSVIENQIRPVALGRRNFLFAGSHTGARRAALIYSLLGTCKINNINPNLWMTDVLRRIPNHPINAIDELLPQNWTPEK